MEGRDNDDSHGASGSSEPEKSFRLTLTGVKQPGSETSFREAFATTLNCRQRVDDIVHSREANIAMAIFIVFNSALVVMQTDEKARGEEPQPWEDIASVVMLVIFAIELACRIVARPIEFFTEWISVVELIVLVLDAVLLVLALLGNHKISMSYLKFVRFVRLRRVLRLLQRFRELFMMLHGMESAFKAMFWAWVIIAGILLIWSIIAVEFIRPLALSSAFEPTDDRSGSFDSVWIASLSLLEITVAGDNWGGLAVPIMRAHPHSAFFFLGSYLTVNLGLMNLIVAVIVDRAAEARAEDEQHRIFEKEKAFKHAHDRFLHICNELDLDDDGQISESEFIYGVTNVPDFGQVLKMLDISTDDLDRIFRYLDVDNSGTLSFNEFIHQVHRLRTMGSNTAQILLGQQITNLCRDIDVHIKRALSFLQGSCENTTDAPGSMQRAADWRDVAVLPFTNQTSTSEPKSQHVRDKDIRNGLEQLRLTLDNQIAAIVASLQDSLRHDEHVHKPDQNTSMPLVSHLRDSEVSTTGIGTLQTSGSVLQNAVEGCQSIRQDSICSQVSVTKIETTTSIGRARLCCA